MKECVAKNDDGRSIKVWRFSKETQINDPFLSDAPKDDLQDLKLKREQNKKNIPNVF
jgi:hypothetical protein